ncbi:Mbov_0400 family ICE element protein [Mesomycoplasma lagogenitalium]|uniref:Uncharacterized protein n=1 Tax=Mesomycoplasma lagogenitalium TaxID=171286 RepID=A0ABY8LSN5_9BACT|nr:hypothetical protein [Mesomycoplasma lagogenitalium]WGI36264.1 hypothetical protein QEG99_02175 [Mesomycoplasma lagogenitalium]
MKENASYSEKLNQYFPPNKSNILTNSFGLKHRRLPVFIYKTEVGNIFYLLARSATDKDNKTRKIRFGEVEYAIIDKNGVKKDMYIDTTVIYQVDEYDLYDIEQKYGKFKKITSANLSTSKFAEIVEKSYFNIENKLASLQEIKFNYNKQKTEIKNIYVPNHKLLDDYQQTKNDKYLMKWNKYFNENDLIYLIKKQQIINHKSLTEMEYSSTKYEIFFENFLDVYQGKPDYFDENQREELKIFNSVVEKIEEYYPREIEKFISTIDFEKNQAFIDELEYDKDLLSEKYLKELKQEEDLGMEM